jgi:hypothetical protein
MQDSTPRTSSDVFALIPDGHNSVTIAAVGDVTDRLDVGEPLDAALTNVGLDSFFGLKGDELAVQVDRVRMLNVTGDTNAFWSQR